MGSKTDSIKANGKAPNKPLTPIKNDSQIKAWSKEPKPEKRQERADGGSSLRLRRTPNGVISFVWYYHARVVDEKTGETVTKHRVKTLGQWPGVSLSKARVEVGKLKAQHRDEGVVADTGKFGSVILDYLDIKTPTDYEGAKQSRQLRGIRAPEKIIRTLLRDVYRHLGDVSILNLSGRHVRVMAEALESSRGKEPARLSVIYAVMVSKWGNLEGTISTDPLVGIKPSDVSVQRTAEDERERVPSRTEIAQLLDIIHTGAGGSDVTRLGWRILLSMGIRCGELNQAAWTEFDFMRKQWTVPGPHRKSGKPIIYGIPDALLPAFQQLHALTSDTGLILGGQDRSSLYQALTRLQRGTKKRPAVLPVPEEDKAHKMTTGEIVIHDFRRAFSTHADAMGFADEDIIEAQLGHKTGTSVKKNYNKANKLPERTALLEKWCWALEDAATRLADDIQLDHGGRSVAA